VFFLIKRNWKTLNKTIWTKLEKRKSAPQDMYIELLRFARRRLSIEVDVATYDALGDAKLARDEFFRLTEPENESKCVELLEGFYSVLQEFKPGIAAAYKEELRGFIEERNLRYVVSDDCRLLVSIQGLLLSTYAKLRKAVAANTHIQQGFNRLEDSVTRLKQVADEERTCISVAANFLEGVACDRTTNRADTLSRAIDGCDLPHQALKDCVKDFYRFASDYPHIRHAGRPSSQLRPLKKDDALLAMTLALAFGAYVYDSNSGNAILSGEL
jgi:hypothetical protein